jgi:hypothetical protein
LGKMKGFHVTRKTIFKGYICRWSFVNSFVPLVFSLESFVFK